MTTPRLPLAIRERIARALSIAPHRLRLPTELPDDDDATVPVERPVAQVPPSAPRPDAQRVARNDELRAMARMAAGPVAVLVIASLLVAGYIALSGDVTISRAATVIVTKPALHPTALTVPAIVAPVPIITAIVPTPSPSVSALSSLHSVALARIPEPLVEIRFDSTPPGASVTIVDNGNARFLGTTPMSTSLDRARRYDVIFALDGHPTQLEHVDPDATRYLKIVLGTTETEPATDTEPTHGVIAEGDPAPVAPVVVAHQTHRRAEPGASAARKTRGSSNDRDQTTAARGSGLLMVSSKPPCEILVDGKRIGLTTPQTGIPLSVGTHRIGLVNADLNIKSNSSVEISPERPTKLIRNFMKN